MYVEKKIWRFDLMFDRVFITPVIAISGNGIMFAVACFAVQFNWRKK